MRKLLLLFVFAVSMSNLVYSQTGTDWKWLHPAPQGNQLRAIQAFSGSTWYVAGLAGTFMKTTDAGATWQFNHQAGLPFATSGQTSNAYDLHFFDETNGLVCGSSKEFLKPLMPVKHGLPYQPEYSYRLLPIISSTLPPRQLATRQVQAAVWLKQPTVVHHGTQLPPV